MKHLHCELLIYILQWEHTKNKYILDSIKQHSTVMCSRASYIIRFGGVRLSQQVFLTNNF